VICFLGFIQSSTFSSLYSSKKSCRAIKEQNFISQSKKMFLMGMPKIGNMGFKSGTNLI